VIPDKQRHSINVTNKCLVVPIRFTAALSHNSFPEMLAKAVIDALEIEADVSNVTSTVRMLDLTNRSSDHIANRLDKELRYQAESLIIFNSMGKCRCKA
jgi:hypothetical protein